MILQDKNNFSKFMSAELFDNKHFSLISVENKLNLVNLMIKNCNKASVIESLLNSMKGLINGTINSTRYFAQFEC